ncbi:MAG: AAA family ATPase [Prevotellaceae bacterium]|jgi:predicted ATP-dependent endonuclease of OLD family|nr:AAA family ATPase [Prevotellaceae bacterium]
MKTINKIILRNFKRFTTFEIDFDSQLNILVGDNESGKSSILQAIDIVLSGNRNKVENIGLEHLFNYQAVNDFMQSDKRYENLPILTIELYLNEQNNQDVFGRNNTKTADYNGLKFVCEPNDDFSSHIRDILQQPSANFPFEYYSINFKTFADVSYSGYKKYLKHIVVDNSQMSSEYAMKEYVQDIYNATVQRIEKLTNQHKYREHKENFKNQVLNDLNNKMSGYCFALKTSPKSNLETDLTILEDNINIENKGKGKQCFIKTELALQRSQSDLDIILIEEPENHLSHINMKKLIHKISQVNNKQIFIATHNDMISARLDLRKTVLLNSNSTAPLQLNSISDDTAKFFMKAPNNNILQFILSKKVILVEGDAEYILMETMYQKVTCKELKQSDIHIIAVGGTSFKRYLELAKKLSIKTAVITDNDGNIDKNITQKYAEFPHSENPNIKIFSDRDESRSTFEICLYSDNQTVCNTLFTSNRRTLSVQDYMLANKADCAFAILDNNETNLTAPQYIIEAIQWIKE